MSEISLYEAQIKKMQGLCDEHNLVYRFQKDRYPILFTIRPTQGMDAQMTMLENAEEAGYRSPDASMTWTFEDGVLETTVRGGTFTISKTLRTKIEIILIKMITYWQQYFFRDVIEKSLLDVREMPTIDEEDDLPENAEPLEASEDDDDEAAAETPEDSLIQTAIRIVRAENMATPSLLQRQLNVRYAEAARILETLEEMGVVSPSNGTQPRDILPYDEPDDNMDGNEGDQT